MCGSHASDLKPVMFTLSCAGKIFLTIVSWFVGISSLLDHPSRHSTRRFPIETHMCKVKDLNGSVPSSEPDASINMIMVSVKQHSVDFIRARDQYKAKGHV